MKITAPILTRSPSKLTNPEYALYPIPKVPLWHSLASSPLIPWLSLIKRIVLCLQHPGGDLTVAEYCNLYQPTNQRPAVSINAGRLLTVRSCLLLCWHWGKHLDGRPSIVELRCSVTINTVWTASTNGSYDGRRMVGRARGNLWL